MATFNSKLGLAMIDVHPETGMELDAVDAAVIRQQLSDQAAQQQRWSRVVALPVFRELVQMVTNIEGEYENKLRDVSDPHQRLDIVQRRNGANAVLKGLQGIIEESGVEMLFEAGKPVDENAFAFIEEQMPDFVALRESWKDLLQQADDALEKNNLTADQLSTFVSRRIGLIDCLTEIKKKIQNAPRTSAPTPSARNTYSVVVPEIPKTAPTKWTTERIEQNTQHAIGYLSKKK